MTFCGFLIAGHTVRCLLSDYKCIISHKSLLLAVNPWLLQKLEVCLRWTLKPIRMTPSVKADNHTEFMWENLTALHPHYNRSMIVYWSLTWKLQKNEARTSQLPHGGWLQYMSHCGFKWRHVFRDVLRERESTLNKNTGTTGMAVVWNISRPFSPEANHLIYHSWIKKHLRDLVQFETDF